MQTWTTALEVGHAEIDAEHRGLYEFTERAADAVAREDAGAVKDALGALFGRSADHFRHEEALMAESAYEELRVHRESHAAFMADFGKLRAELEARGLSPLFRLWFGARFQDWLRFHIRGQDVQFYRHLRRRQEAQAREAEARLAAEAKAADAPGPKPPAGG